MKTWPIGFMLLMLGACSTADTTGTISQKEYDYTLKVINNSTGTVNMTFPTTVNATAATTMETDQETDNDPSTRGKLDVGYNRSPADIISESATTAVESVDALQSLGNVLDTYTESSSSTVVTPDLVVPSKPAPTFTAPPLPGGFEELRYYKRTNGDRATWYADKPMSAFPNSFTVIVSGCYTINVTSNNGDRFTANGYIVKESSEADGRGMAIVAPSTCLSKLAGVK